MMVINTTCTCNACKNISNLDLKFFVHHGTFLLQQLGSHAELIGTDVNLIHRLAKNSIVEKTGIKAYTAYTQTAIDALDIPKFSTTMVPHEQIYDVGRVSVHVQDMTAVWERERTRVRTIVKPEDTLVSASIEVPVPPTLAWDYVTKPEYRAKYTMSDEVRFTSRSDGRLGDGAVYVCAHGKSVYRHTVVDWQPFEQYTYQSKGFFRWDSALITTQLTPTENGTRVITRIGKVMGPFVTRVIEDVITRFVAVRPLNEGCQILLDVIEQDLAEGRLTQPTAADQSVGASSSEIEAAAAESLMA